MPRLTASKEEVKGQPQLPEGLYTVRLDGFKPKYSKDRGSVNLNPVMKIINHAEHNDRPVFDNLNSKAKWIWKDFCHAFGVPVVELPDGGIEFPGDFPGPEDNPEQWSYVGPLLGQQGQVYLVQTQYNGQDQTKIKFYVCKLGPQCKEKHSTNLAK